MTPMLRTTFRRAAAATTAAGIIWAASVAARAQRESAVPSNPDSRTIEHVLNRLGFGPRPGDVDRVRQMGLATYIDQQLSPDRVPDTELTARLAAFQTLSMSTRDLNE